MVRRAAIGLTISATLVVASLVVATRGFSAFTTDAARALDVATEPVVVPTIALVDMRHTTQRIPDPRRSTIVGFIYTRCVTMCSALGGVFQQLQTAIASRGLASQVRLLSVSFDPAWDTPARLRPYVHALRADPDIWTIAAPANPDRLPALLKTFGIRVIDDGRGGFDHNAALHVVDPAGRLVAILPFDAIGEALDVAQAHAGNRGTAR